MAREIGSLCEDLGEERRIWLKYIELNFFNEKNGNKGDISVQQPMGGEPPLY